MNFGIRMEKLRRDHPVDGFDCGNEALNRFLTRHALQSQMAGAANTYLAIDESRVVGFHSLAVGEVAHGAAPERLVKGLARHPVMLLARLAVNREDQGRGLGAGLLMDAMARTLRVADIAGVRALVTNAKDDGARAFYGHFQFSRFPNDPYYLHLLIKDLRAALAG